MTPAENPLVLPNLPTGTVTFLFTDVEGSTRLLHDLGAEAYADALAEHRRVLRDAFAAHGGAEVDTQGDAFFVAFARASDALTAAREAQAALSGPVRVRMGLHTGEPLVTDEGHLILDAGCGRIERPEDLAAALNAVPGVVEHGLFLGLATGALIATHEGVLTIGRV